MIWSNKIQTPLLRGMLLGYGISLERGGVRLGDISRMSLYLTIIVREKTDEIVKQTLLILDSRRPGSLLRILSHMRGNMIRLLLRILPRRDCSLGMSPMCPDISQWKG